MSTDWSRDEVELIVADYFVMLKAGAVGAGCQQGGPQSSARSASQLALQGLDRFKHANISAALLALGDLPTSTGQAEE